MTTLLAYRHDGEKGYTMDTIMNIKIQCNKIEQGNRACGSVFAVVTGPDIPDGAIRTLDYRINGRNESANALVDAGIIKVDQILDFEGDRYILMHSDTYVAAKIYLGKLAEDDTILACILDDPTEEQIAICRYMNRVCKGMDAVDRMEFRERTIDYLRGLI